MRVGECKVRDGTSGAPTSVSGCLDNKVIGTVCNPQQGCKSCY